MAVFPQGLREVYGPEVGETAANIMKDNIAHYIELKRPSVPQNNSGTFQWGLCEEQRDPQRGLTISSDLATGVPAGVVPMLHFLESLRNITRAVDAYFGAIDNITRNAYQESFRRIPQSHRRLIEFGPDGHDQLFTSTVLLANLGIQPHRDAGDWDQGWAWIVVLGEFTGGDFAITELKRRIPFPHGAVLGLRGGALEHWTTKWEGQRRYSLVFTFQEFVRSF